MNTTEAQSLRLYCTKQVKQINKDPFAESRTSWTDKQHINNTNGKFLTTLASILLFMANM